MSFGHPKPSSQCCAYSMGKTSEHTAKSGVFQTACHSLPSMQLPSFDSLRPSLRAPLGGLEDPRQLEGIRVLGMGSGSEAGSAHCGQSRRFPGPPSREASHPVTPWPRVAHGSPRKTCGRAREGLRSLRTGSGSAHRLRPRAPPSPPTKCELADWLRPRAGALPPTASGSAARPRPLTPCVRAYGPPAWAAPPPPVASAGPSGFAGGPHLPGPARPGPAVLGPPRAPAAAAPPPWLLRAPPGTAASAPAGRKPGNPGGGAVRVPAHRASVSSHQALGPPPLSFLVSRAFGLFSVWGVCGRGSPCCLGHLYPLQPGGGSGQLGRCSQPRPSAVRFFLGYHMGDVTPQLGDQTPAFQFPTGSGLSDGGGRGGGGRESYLGSSQAGSVALATDSRLQALPR